MKRGRKKKTILIKCMNCNRKHYIEERVIVVIDETIDGKHFISKSVCPHCSKESYYEYEKE